MKEEQKTNYQVIEVKNCPFNIIKKDESYHICCGGSIASEKVFPTEEAARKHIKKTDWQMVGTLIIKIINYNDKDKEIKKNLD